MIYLTARQLALLLTVPVRTIRHWAKVDGWRIRGTGNYTQYNAEDASHSYARRRT